jgi:adenylate kinase
MLCSELRAFPSGRNLLYGSQHQEGGKIPKAVRRVIPKSQPKVLLRTLPQCSLVVYCLQNSSREELNLVLGSLETYDFEKPFTFVLVSSAESWGATKIPEPAEGEEPREVLIDADFASRQPLPGFESYVEIENRVLAMHKRCNGNLETFVVNAGILYGMGEEAFHDLFKDAWLSKDPATIAGAKSGENFVPCCHVRDCARLVKTIAMNDDRSAGFGDQNYFLAVDKSQITQGQIIRSIFTSMSDVGAPPVDASATPPPALSLDLKMQASGVMGDDFEWSHAEGLVNDLAEITVQFTKARDLRPVRVLVAGPPLVGKTVQANLIATHFNLPLVSSASVVAEANASDSELGKEFRLHVEELRGAAGGVAAPRVSPEWLLKLFAWKLGSNVCRTRGFVLDGYPRNVDEAKGLFMVDEVGEDGEPPAEDAEVPKVLGPNTPAFVVSLDCSEESLRRRSSSMPDDDLVPGHNDTAGLQRRLDVYQGLIQQSGSCVDFFQDNQIETLHVDIDAEGGHATPQDLFETARIYMEAKGRPYNYLESSEVVDARRFEELEAAEQETAQSAETETRAATTKEKDPESESKGEADRIRIIAKHENERDAWLKKPLRPFLMDCAVPALSDALVELCRASPEDPLEFLASYLEREAVKDYVAAS